MSEARWYRKALGLSGQVLLMAALTLVLAEVGLRVVGRGDGAWPKPHMLENADKSRGLECSPSSPHGELPLDLREPEVMATARSWGLDGLEEVAETTPWCVPFRYNAHTRRDDDFAPSPGPSVLVVGDSFTEGAGVPEALTFARRLGQALGPEVRVFNGGRRGLDQPELVDSLAMLLPQTRPDLVVYALVLNDFELDPAWAERQEYLNDLILDRQHMGRPTWKLPAWASHSRLLTTGAAAWRSRKATTATREWYLGMVGPENAGGWARTQDDLSRMDDLCKGADAHLLIAVLPLLYGAGADYPFAPVHAELMRACQDRGLDCVDLAPMLDGQSMPELWVHPVDMHPSGAGHALIAQALEPRVRHYLEERRRRSPTRPSSPSSSQEPDEVEEEAQVQPTPSGG